jgi:hypothetical protein
MPKRSRLLRKCPIGFQMVETKWPPNLAAILFLLFESRTNRSSPDLLKSGLTSLDRFTNKGNKKYFIHAKTV